MRTSSLHRSTVNLHVNDWNMKHWHNLMLLTSTVLDQKPCHVGDAPRGTHGRLMGLTATNGSNHFHQKMSIFFSPWFVTIVVFCKRSLGFNLSFKMFEVFTGLRSLLTKQRRRQLKSIKADCSGVETCGDDTSGTCDVLELSSSRYVQGISAGYRSMFPMLVCATWYNDVIQCCQRIIRPSPLLEHDFAGVVPKAVQLPSGSCSTAWYRGSHWGAMSSQWVREDMSELCG